jgi:hypothetical protein
MMARLMFLALMALFRHNSQYACMHRMGDQIAEKAEQAASTHHVPLGLLLAVGMKETHCGCDEPDWGAPLSRRFRHVPGTVDTAAQALERSYAVCGTWRGAVTRFRSGLCTLHAGDPRLGYVADVMSIAQRIYVGAGLPVDPAITASRALARTP